jgi:hypothetical protein
MTQTSQRELFGYDEQYKTLWFNTHQQLPKGSFTIQKRRNSHYWYFVLGKVNDGTKNRNKYICKAYKGKDSNGVDSFQIALQKFNEKYKFWPLSPPHLSPSQPGWFKYQIPKTNGSVPLLTTPTIKPAPAKIIKDPRPKTIAYTLREWYNKFYSKGVGYDKRYDRPHVWENKPVLQTRWQDSLETLDTDNPFVYVNCLTAKTIADDFENTKYYEDFISSGYIWLSVIGKNRTQATARAFEKWEIEDPTKNDTITVDVKEYSYLSRKVVSRKYRAEKQGYPDNRMMERTGFYGSVGDHICKVEEVNMDIYEKILASKEILDLVARQLETDFAMFAMTSRWDIGTIGDSEMGRAEYQDFMWEDNHFNKGKYDKAHKGWREYWLHRTTDDLYKKHKKPKVGWIRMTYALFQWINMANYKYDSNDIPKMVKLAEEWISQNYLDKTHLNYQREYTYHGEKKLLKDYIQNQMIKHDQWNTLMDVLAKELLTGWIEKELLIPYDSVNFSPEDKTRIYSIDDGFVRQNGQVKGKWFKDVNEFPEWIQISYLEMLNSTIVVDHWFAKRGGGITEIDNGELTTSEYNSFKSSYEANYESPKDRRKK